LGASRRRLAGELLLESMILSLLGGALGLLLALWGVAGLRALGPDTLPRVDEIGLDLRVLGFALALSLVTGLLFGLAPMWRMAGRDLHEGLAGGSRGVAGSAGIHRARSALVLGEVALAFVLLAGASLLLRSFERLQRVDPGFAADRVLTARVTLPRLAYPKEERWLAFGRELLARTEAEPGVRSAALVSDAPLGDSPPYWGFAIQGGETPPPDAVQDAAVFTASASYFETLRIPLVRGRLFEASDRAGGRDVALVNQSAAQRYWRGSDPVGARITFGDPADPETQWMTVVGIVGDVLHERLNGAAYPQIYIPFEQSPMRSMVLVARTSGDPLATVPAVRRAISGLDPGLPLADVSTMEDRKAVSLARPRVNATVLGGFALAALVLAAVGIYGVVAYGVVQRTRELGIRMALGAGDWTLLRMVIRQGMMPVLGGMGVGLVGALAGGRLLRGLLFGVGSGDPTNLALVTGFLVAVALAAMYLPARRASRSDPMIALRTD
jgi:putative ABC transport system permease protein